MFLGFFRTRYIIELRGADGLTICLCLFLFRFERGKVGRSSNFKDVVLVLSWGSLDRRTEAGLLGLIDAE